MIGLTAQSSTGSGRTVKPYTVSRLKWVALVVISCPLKNPDSPIKVNTVCFKKYLTAIKATDMIYNTIQSNSSSFIHTTDNT
ncbi:hypothetical protein CRENPOLYSF1_530022 [Crenothrix polyspora]|uniref:Uncharacterized protein n=1 Tax=Crenothrix polyspora TaxID=360316 RepID=A0A1R4HDK5_9GAMM|nr:hypothetical protein CRENPOLYSF1_530022 [Crenothrix polyspora]